MEGTRFATDERRPGVNGGDQRDGSPSPKPPLDPAVAIGMIGQELGQLRAFIAYYIGTRVDAVKLAARNVVLYAILGVLALVMGAGVILTAGVLLVLGIADLLTAAIPPHAQWLGFLMTAVLILGGLALTAYIGLARVTHTSRLAVAVKYEKWREQQRAALGTDVHEQAGSAKAGN